MRSDHSVTSGLMALVDGNRQDGFDFEFADTVEVCFCDAVGGGRGSISSAREFDEDLGEDVDRNPIDGVHRAEGGR